MNGGHYGRRLLHRHHLHHRRVLSPNATGGARPRAGLRPADARDLGAVLALLREAGLPTEGVGRAFSHFVVAERDGAIVGGGGLEVVGTEALLRSIAVRADARGAGTGRDIVKWLIALAATQGLSHLWLLTTTAPEFFAGLGFSVRERSEAPETIRATEEFTTCCPASAVLMSRRAAPLRVLVLCTANVARSQMAEALLGHRFGDQVEVASAGTDPGPGPHPHAISVLRERGIAWNARRSKGIDAVAEHWDLVITVCDGARETCPVWPGTPMLHWSLPDPVPGGIEAFRAVADQLQARIDLLRV